MESPPPHLPRTPLPQYPPPPPQLETLGSFAVMEKQKGDEGGGVFSEGPLGVHTSGQGGSKSPEVDLEASDLCGYPTMHFS